MPKITSESADYPLYLALMKMGITQCYSSQIVSQKREPSLPLAVKILNQTGYKIGPLAGRTPNQIMILKKASRLLYETK
jgi:hypothetical protein